MRDDERWQLATRSLCDSTSAQDAAQSADTLIDAAVPGGAAIGPMTMAVVEAVCDHVRHPGAYRAYGLAVLAWVGRVINVYRSWVEREIAAGRTPAPSVRAVADAEKRAHSFLRDLVPGLLIDPDRDPEARSMTYLLAGRVVDPHGVEVQALLSAAETDPDERAAACALESTLVALARAGSARPAPATDRFRRLAAEASVGARQRLRSLLRPGHFEVDADDVRDTLAGVASSLPSGEPPRWAAESI